MKNERYCCDARCMQGRDCPARPEFLLDSEEPDRTEWIARLIAALIIVGAIAAAVGMCAS